MHMVMQAIVLQDAVLRGIRAEKRKLRWPADACEAETLEHKEVARVNKIHEDVGDAYDGVAVGPSIAVRTCL